MPNFHRVVTWWANLFANRALLGFFRPCLGRLHPPLIRLRATVPGAVLHSAELKPPAPCYSQLREGRSRWSWETVASLALRYSTTTGNYSS